MKLSRSDGRFYFKRFSVAHSRSSMKVGVDGVLVALWSRVPPGGRILDAGTGCGVIALICAQRSSTADILAIDKDSPSVAEASANFRESPWSSRMVAENVGFEDMLARGSGKFDLIVSNPPFFDSGVASGISRRLDARHQGSLSPSVLLASASSLLTEVGNLSMVLPAEMSAGLEEMAGEVGMALSRITLVRGREDAPVKRALMEFVPLSPDVSKLHCVRDTLILEEAPGCPTEDYRVLGRDFYLKF